MTGELIKELLQEAIISDNYFRRMEILSELKTALWEKSKRHWDDKDVSLCINCLVTIMDTLFWGYINKCPEKLMVILPLFMMLCGDLPTTDSMNRLGRVDWNYFLEIINDD